MSRCVFEAPGRQEACLSLMRQREEGMTRPYDENPCYACPMRVKRLEAAKPPQKIHPPPPEGFGRTSFRAASAEPERSPKTTPPKSEVKGMDREKIKENVLRVLGRNGSLSISSLKNFAWSKGPKEEIRAAVDELAGEGKVVGTPGAREGSLTVSLPGGALPVSPPQKREEKKKSAAPSIKATRTPKTIHPVNPSPSNGSGNLAAVIADLEAKRNKIDVAIETLRALA